MLSPAQKRDYAEKGFVRVPGVLAEKDIAALTCEWSRLWREVDPAHPSVQRRDHATLGDIPDRIDPAYLHSPLLRKLCDDRRIAGLAEAALDAPAALFKDKLISKQPGTAGYGLHQDWPYWIDIGIPWGRMVTVMIAFDPSDADNGAMELWPGERRLLPADPADPRDVDPSAVDPLNAEMVAMDAGDALLFHSLVPHRSAPNRSQSLRRAYFPTYVDAVYRHIADCVRTAREALSPGSPR